VKASIKRVIIVYQLFDNSVFFAAQEDGTIYHVPVRHEVADHITNKKDKNFCHVLVSSLASMRDTIRDVVFAKKIRTFKAVSPILLLAYPEVDEEAASRRLQSLWKDDLVHIAAEGYSDLADNLMEIATNCSFTRTQHNHDQQARSKQQVQSAWTG
jgi:hypothetical protein